jgi:hypothetical protein
MTPDRERAIRAAEIAAALLDEWHGAMADVIPAALSLA